MASQSTLLGDAIPGAVSEAVALFAALGTEERGAIYTRREVVDFILDLAGYTPNRALYKLRLLEPSFGEGDFLLAIIERLIASCRRHGNGLNSLDMLAESLCAVELHETSYDETKKQVIDLLNREGFERKIAQKLADLWLVKGDFLLFDPAGKFDFVVGNPPYVRQELVPDALMREYRSRFKTIYDRADLYIPFIENSLRVLTKGGTLGFICSDRWMKNRYGGPLRQMVADGFHLKAYVDMVDTDAFHAEVSAYPAITIITREKPGKTRIAHKPAIDRNVLSSLARELTSKKVPANENRIKEIAGVTAGASPWILESTDQLAVLRRLERDFPSLEEAGCKVGIGVATGADKAYIGPYDALDVEPDRKLPLVRTKDILEGEVIWQGSGIINPFGDDGRLVDLKEYPRLRRYLEERKDQIAKRHVAQKAPANWYRTIDRIYPELTEQKKLLIPDIKGDAHIVYEDGKLYPHHNLYFITAQNWDLRALQAVLKSGIARLFVSTYSTKMRGGYLRFQAQYLRRIRIPYWHDVPKSLRKQLMDVKTKESGTFINEAVYELYGLTKEERTALGGNGKIIQG
ncbi:MAG: Eco57I restriction-modification methylase domain-containing protein [Candidatus Thiodiazotropha taylori]|nr:Eco57I restriction-modification methylase domain-containing protein [Candidatus Thiodiazotropha taylori]